MLEKIVASFALLISLFALSGCSSDPADPTPKTGLIIESA